MASRATIRHADWREQLALNERRTFSVLGLFILIYTGLGFLLDVYWRGGFARPGHWKPVAQTLLSFEPPPLITLVMGGVALLSVSITFLLYDRLMLLGTDAHEITDRSATPSERVLYHVVEELKVASGLRVMPRIYVIEADYMNAFASGYSEKSAMIAITRGLLQKLDRQELQAVMGHELSHIRHGDIKLTLAVSILSNLMLIVIDLAFYHMLFKRDSRKEDQNFLWIIMIARYLLPLTTVLMMLYLSRTREYMADAGSVELLRDNHPLIRALIKIHSDHAGNHDRYRAEYRQHQHEEIRRASYIFDPQSMGLSAGQSIATLFSTHPPLQARLKALGAERE